MIELLLASTLIGKVEISPNVIQLDYLTPDSTIITYLDNIELKGNYPTDFN
jgi:hypothetical protein